jgi:VWFA-related protein
MRLLLFTAIAFLLVCPVPARAQSCLTKDDIEKLLARANPPGVSLNKDLQKELQQLAIKQQQLFVDVINENPKKQSLDKLRELNRKDTARLCEILKNFGWPTEELVGRSGVSAAFQLLKNCAPFEMQRDMLRVIIAALQKDPGQKAEFAGLYDRLCVSAGLKQRFGTQAASRNGFLILYPIEDEKRVEARRQEFGLGPLTEYIRGLERTYHQPLVKARQAPQSEMSPQLKKSLTDAVNVSIFDSDTVSEGDIIRVNTNLVNLNVSVFNEKSKSFVGSLAKEDFKVFEDGHEETVTYFASTDVPFDLVLLIDLSGSTIEKRDLIRKSTLRFIETARATDRVAIVTFAAKPTVLSPLTHDRTKLRASVGDMSGGGGTSVFDALKFTLDTVIEPRTIERRRAVVFMTDGVDSSVMAPGTGLGSNIAFADLIQIIGQNDTLIVPIYLDTEPKSQTTQWNKILYANARKMLAVMASESGGSYYQARKLADLEGVYQQVINDLGKVYSLGYKPTNEQRDGSWRNVEIQIVNRPDLTAHARPGYYAK